MSVTINLRKRHDYSDPYDRTTGSYSSYAGYGAADEAISDAELSRVERLIDFLPVFENFPPEDLDIVTESFVELMSVEEGLDSLMTLLANTLPDELHETAMHWLLKLPLQI